MICPTGIIQGVGEAKTDPPSLSRRSAGLQSCYDLSCYAKQRLRGCCELSTALRGMRSCIASYALIEAAKLQSATARFREAVQRGRACGIRLSPGMGGIAVTRLEAFWSSGVR